MKRPLAWSSALLLLLLGSRMSTAVPCTSSQLAAPTVVQDSEGVHGLVAAVNCSGGSFDVEWVGSVIVEDTIRLFGGTTLNITGAVDRTSVANGANMTSLFEVASGTLRLYHLSLVGGKGERGGAIYATDALLTTASCIISSNTGIQGGGAYLDNTALELINSSFTHNVASGIGGAMYVRASNVTVGERVLFESNKASSGGALYVSGSSILTVAGDNIAFARNTATTDGGGGLLLWNSILHVDHFGRVQYFGNIAISGGAIHSFNSRVVFDGNVVFANNFAGDRGGGLYSDCSAVNVTGTALWENNTSLNTGGGAAVWKSTVHVVAGSNVSFSNNIATVGGGMFIGENAAVVITGLATFSHNVAETGAGIKMAIFSSANFTGSLVVIQGNTASSSGGGIHIESPTLLELHDVDFLSNYAGVDGGAVTTILAGTERVAEVEATPAIIMNCWFSDNTATDAGGALFIGGGFVDITGSYFYNNVAGEEVFCCDHRIMEQNRLCLL